MSIEDKTEMRFLVVDDEEALRRLLQRSFTRCGHACDAAADGVAALELISSNSYDLVVTDLRMPRMHGHALSVELLSRDNHPRIIAITGVPEPRLADDLTSRGVDEVMSKPVAPDILVKRAEEIVHEALSSGPSDATGAGENGNESTADVAKHQVAVLLAGPERSQDYAAAIAGDDVAANACGSAEELHVCLEEQNIDVLVISQNQGGFLSGEEIIQRAGQGQKSFDSVLLADGDTFKEADLERLGIHSILPASASSTDVTALVQKILTERASATPEIPEIAVRFMERCSTLPSPPEILSQLLEYMEMEASEIDVERLSGVLSSDAATASELLRLTNNASYRLSHEVHRVVDAVTLLGPKKAIVQVFSALMIERIKQLEKVPEAVRDWYHRRSIQTACVASSLANQLEDVSADLAFAMGMMQDIGMMIMAQEEGASYCSLIQRARIVPDADLAEMEQEQYGITHADIGAALLSHWELPVTLLFPVFDHHRRGQRSGDAADAAMLRVMAIGEAVTDFNEVRHPHRKQRMDNLLNEYGASESKRCSEAIAKAIDRAAEATRLFSIPAASKRSLTDQSVGTPEANSA